jgi:hypothetical protein
MGRENGMQGRALTPPRRPRQLAVVGLLALALAGGVSCGQANSNSGRSPSVLYIESLLAASGAKPDEFGNVLESDVITNVKVQVGSEQVLRPTIFEDSARATLRITLKDVGSPNAPTMPTGLNSVTVTRYRVTYKRTDGRNTPGVDVPYGFDGAATGTFDSNGGTLSFVVVRAQAKLEAPLKALAGGGGSIVISTIAEITFYGKDLAGNDVQVTGAMTINFADWGDPA